MEKKQSKLLLVVVAKAPVAGQVKTRLIPYFTPDEAVELYRCLLLDRMMSIRTITGVDLAIAYAPDDAKDAFLPYSHNGIGLFAQKGQSLGDRLNNIFLEKLHAGYDAVSIIDSDTPDLPTGTIQESFKRLATGKTDVVFGPCFDGGYYLVGMCAPHSELFIDIPWSTESVLAITLAKARNLGIVTDLLAWWNDLDTFEDLVEFYGKYQNQQPEGHWAGENTFNYLSRLKRICRGNCN